MNKRKKAMVVNYNALSKEKRNTTEIESSREDIEQHYGKTMKKAAEELGATFVTVENEIDKKFKLKHGTSKIKYLEKCRSICSSTACASTQPVAGPVKYVTFKTGNVILAFVDSWIKTKTFAKEKRESIMEPR
ncbi:hypothetical protein Tco_0802234 [Tanacetum coccineum]|uniref:Uncharacterized protein n=1 Tax=Tanacetum coccineum TaxID=301880 RepID=A0ABQ5A102_9ASTR